MIDPKLLDYMEPENTKAASFLDKWFPERKNEVIPLVIFLAFVVVFCVLYYSYEGDIPRYFLLPVTLLGGVSLVVVFLRYILSISRTVYESIFLSSEETREALKITIKEIDELVQYNASDLTLLKFWYSRRVSVYDGVVKFFFNNSIVFSALFFLRDWLLGKEKAGDTMSFLQEHITSGFVGVFLLCILFGSLAGLLSGLALDFSVINGFRRKIFLIDTALAQKQF